MANVDLTRFDLLKRVMTERFGDPRTIETERHPKVSASPEQLKRQEVLRDMRS
jgi:hypothetical protein